MSTLTERLAATDSPLDLFLTWVSERGIELYDAQEEAILELFEGNHVLLKTPTGSGKSLVATALHLYAMSRGEKSVYTAPIKALVSEKFRSLATIFGAENVGLMTGDGSVNRDAPILCCTAEILAKIALRHGEETPYTCVIADEFHYYGDRDRGMAWQLPLLTMPHAQFLLLSATLGDTSHIEADLKERTGREVACVDQAERPVPLTFEYSEVHVDEMLGRLVYGGRAPVYAVHFSQREATELAQALMSRTFTGAEKKAEIAAAIKGFRFDSPFGQTLRRYVLHGVGLHHAGLLPKYRILVERLAQEGLFTVICGTDTLGVGINVPIRSVLFTKLCKFDGASVDILAVRDFLQVAGRAGRKGYDTEGSVIVQAPDWVIENNKLQELVESGLKKRGKVKKKSAPTKGYRHWDENVFNNLVRGRPEALEGTFVVDHGLVLQLLQKAEETLGDAMAELRELIERSHTGQRKTALLLEEADARLGELISAGVVVDHGPDSVPQYAVQADLQQDFSLYHSLSLFLLHCLDLLDKESPDYAMDLLSLVEAILEHPKTILFAQVRRAKGEAVARMKADGVPYDERMEALEEVTYPKPRGEWIYGVYNAFAETNPWLATEPIRPKAIARELAETQSTFAAMVKELGLERSEGVVLRYLSQVYTTLAHNVPEAARTPAVDDVIAYLRALIARVDDSLIKTWEGMLASDDPSDEDAGPIDISADAKSFRARIRQELYSVVRALHHQDWDEAVASLHASDESWSKDDMRTAIRPYMDERGPVPFDGRIKQGWTTIIQEDGPHRWTVSQVIVDDETGNEDDDAGEQWSIDGVVDLSEDTNPEGPLVRLVSVAGA
ncbi:MAG: superfamily II RNA helicase [Myxococcota bacterium]|jgi:superfamily II RNA helicase